MPRQQSNSCSIGTKSSLFYPRASLANQTSLDYLKINQDGFSKIIQTSCCKQWIFCLFVCLFSNWRNIKDEMCFMVTHWCFNMFQSSEWHRPTCCCTAVQGWWQNKTQTVLVAWSTFLFHICFWSDIRFFFFLTGSENTRQERCRCCCCCCWPRSLSVTTISAEQVKTVIWNLYCLP